MKKSICIILVLVFAVGCLALVGCNETADNTKYYDSITKQLKLNKDYEGKNFITDGIGAAKLQYTTDGDTTTFMLEPSGETVTIRYHGIDTPESTGGVEKWGKAASLFNKERLTVEGTEYVLQATGPRAEHDSYGVRYLGYVWYKHPGESDFKCLNLEMVENGFSENQCINTSAFPYYDYFNRANKFAQSIKLRIYSELDDPLYSTDPVDVTLKEFEENIDLYYNEEADSGAKIRFYAILTSVRVSESGTFMFKALQFDEDGTARTINVYAGYSSAQASGMPLGHMYRIIGNVQKYSGQYQVSGILYDPIFGAHNPAYTTPTQENYFLTFDSELTYTSHYIATLYTDVTVVSSSVENNVLTIVGTAQQRRKAGPKEEVVTFTFKVPVAEGYVNDVYTAGVKFSVQGFQYVKDSKEITILNYSDIIKR